MSMFRRMHKLLIFNDEKLLYQALTHRSYINEHFGTAGNKKQAQKQAAELALTKYNRLLPSRSKTID
jgi:dsRNA-specific ribonuclease